MAHVHLDKDGGVVDKAWRVCCGLHVIHGAVQRGANATGWGVDSFLGSLFYLYKDTPARREDFGDVTASARYPMKFCRHRRMNEMECNVFHWWVENVPVVERAIQIWPDIQEYMKAARTGKVSKPTNKSFEVVDQWCKDPLALSKLMVFKSVAKQVTPFLTKYQTDKPMIPFLAEDLQKIVKGLMNRFIKDEVLQSHSTCQQIVKVDVADKKNHCAPKKIDLGFSAEKTVKELLTSKKINELDELKFRKDSQQFLVSVTEKILEKCPLKYTLVRNMKCLDPRCMASTSLNEEMKKKMTRLLTILVESKRISENDCDDIVYQYVQFLQEVVPSSMSQFKDFDPLSDRVDKLLYEMMASCDTYNKLWGVVKMLLLISHGQASVERGFSINRTIETENLKEESYVSLRVICDHVHSVGGLTKVPVTTALLLSAGSARQRYQTYLDEKKKQAEEDIKSKKRKSVIDEIDEMKKKKKCMEQDISELLKSADKYAQKAEMCSSLSCISKSNSLRRSATEKKETLKEIEKELDNKITEMKNM